MPTHYYAASGVKRVRYFSVTCKDSWPPCTVFARLNTRKKPERELGTITTKEDLLTGRDFQLQDGSLLRVRLHGARIHLMRNGQPLPQIPIPTSMLVERRILNRTNSAAAAVALAGILSVIGYPLFVLFLDGTGSDVSSRVPQLVITAALGIVFIVLSVFVYRYSQIALITASVLYGLDTLLLLFQFAGGFQLGATPSSNPVTSLVSHGLFLFWMLRGIVPVKQVCDAVARERVRFGSLAQSMPS